VGTRPVWTAAKNLAPTGNFFVFSCTVLALHPYFLCVLVYCVCTSPCFFCVLVYCVCTSPLLFCVLVYCVCTSSLLFLLCLGCPAFRLYIYLQQTNTNTNILAPGWIFLFFDSLYFTGTFFSWFCFLSFTVQHTQHKYPCPPVVFEPADPRL
jgi:hypothetical protein